MIKNSECIILSTGNLLRDRNVLSIEAQLYEMMEKTEKELLIITYTVSSKPEIFWEKIEELLKRNVKMKIIIDGSIEHDRKALKLMENLNATFYNFQLLKFTGPSPLHAKFIVSDGKRAILGSANITGGGLFQNQEVAIYMEGEKAWTLKNLAVKVINHIKQTDYP
jgi:phosphatidylserine/phosphatidylglycerophosphate/cardiolipin synthase-like enzyme